MPSYTLKDISISGSRTTRTINIRPWTDEEHWQLCQLIAKGFTAPEIAKQLRRSRSSVLGRAWRFRMRIPNVNYPHLTPRAA